MRNKRKIIVAMMATLGLFSVSSRVMASDFLTLAPLIADVNATSAGAEFIIPHFVEKDTNADTLADKLLFRYDVFAYNSKNKLYSTASKATVFPAPSCAAPQWQNGDVDPIFVRSGKWMITGMNVATECWSETEGEQEKTNAFLYIADVSVAGGEVHTLLFKNLELSGVDLVDINGDTKPDLMATMMISGQTNENVRIYGVDLQSGSVITDQTYLISQH